MTSPYTTPPMPQPARPAPKWARKRYVLPAIGFAFFIGIGAGASDPQTTDAKTTAAKPGPTVTVTATETTEAKVEPAPTVTATETVKVKVTKTVTAHPADDSGSDDSASGGSSTGGGSTYYANCTAARAAGAAPVRRGQPGYGSHLDRDGDGIGCDS
jgi:hypothetical protein